MKKQPTQPTEYKQLISVSSFLEDIMKKKQPKQGYPIVDFL